MEKENLITVIKDVVVVDIVLGQKIQQEKE